MKFGLTEKDLSFITTTIAKFIEIEQAIIFGSRAKGNYKSGSDVDIAIVGEKINFTTVSKLHSILEDESPMPYLFDIVDYTHLTNDELKEHIDRVGIIFTPKII